MYNRHKEYDYEHKAVGDYVVDQNDSVNGRGKYWVGHRLAVLVGVVVLIVMMYADGGLSASLAQAATPDPSAVMAANNAAQVKQLRMFNAIGGTSFISRVAFSPDGKWLAVSKTYGAGGGEVDHTIQLWDVVKGFKKFILEGHTDAANDVAFSADGTLLASVSLDMTIRLWDVETGKQESIIETKPQCTPSSVAFALDSTTIAVGCYEVGIQLWDVKVGKQLKTLADPNSYSVAFTPDGKLIASGSDNMVRLWDVATGKQAAVLEGHTDRIIQVAMSVDGTLLASCGTDQTVRLWDMKTRKQVSMFEHPDWVTAVAISPNGELIATGSSDYMLRLWDAKTGKQLKVLEGHSHPVSSVAFNPSGTLLAGGDFDLKIRLWGLRK
jgi:WD40 repeat protein